MAEVDPIGNPEFTYVQVTGAIAARIRAGQYTHRLTAERPLAAELGVSCQTLRHGIKLLREQGIVVTRQGRGNFIAPPHPEGPA